MKYKIHQPILQKIWYNNILNKVDNLNSFNYMILCLCYALILAGISLISPDSIIGKILINLSTFPAVGVFIFGFKSVIEKKVVE